MYIQASLKVLPKGKDRIESYRLVDEVLIIIKKANLKYLIGPSETTVEGELNEIMELIEKIHLYYESKKIEFSFFINTEYNNDKFYIEDKKNNIEKLIKK